MQLKKGLRVNTWELISKLGAGGNGQVWKAQAESGKRIAAIKFLLKTKDTARLRFATEIQSMIALGDITGVMPVFESTLDEKGLSWYAMPVGIPLMNWAKHRNIEDISRIFVSLAKTLELIHDRGYTHRDIKPGNILLLDDAPNFSDFGLVHFEGKEKVTVVHTAVGPRSTIAPEMRSAADVADYKAADVFSFAKSLWIALTGEMDGFEGEYGEEAKTKLLERYPRKFLQPLHELFARATSLNPQRRPKIHEFSLVLKEWLTTIENSIESTTQHWLATHKSIFGVALPKHAVWESNETILQILQHLSRTGHIHHMYFPQGGGLDLAGVRESIEPGLLELDVGAAFYIVRPVRLVFEGFDVDEAWDYYILECEKTPNPIGMPKRYKNFSRPDYLELKTGELTSTRHNDWDDWRGESLPADSRIVVRPNAGKYLFVGKQSIYNRSSATYDGRHNKYSIEEFRQGIELAISESRKLKRVTASKKISPNRPKFVVEGFDWLKDSKNIPALDALGVSDLRKIIRLAKIYRAKANEHRLSDPDGFVDVFSVDVQELVRQIEIDRANRKPLVDAIDALSKDAIAELLALMWVGRDLKGRFARLSKHMWDRYKQAAKSEKDVGYMVEKTDFGGYLIDGLRILTRAQKPRAKTL